MRRSLIVLAGVLAATPLSAPASAKAASGTVPGITGPAALQAAGLAAARFLFLRTRTAAHLDAQLHTSWGIRMPFSGGSLGLRAAGTPSAS